MIRKREGTVLQVLSEPMREAIDELTAWANTPKRMKFVEALSEFFDPTSLVLIARAVDKAKIEQ